MFNVNPWLRHTYRETSTHMYIQAYPQTHTNICAHASYTHTYREREQHSHVPTAHTQTHMNICTHATYTETSIHMYIQVCTQTYINMYTHAPHTHTHDEMLKCVFLEEIKQKVCKSQDNTRKSAVKQWLLPMSA